MAIVKVSRKFLVFELSQSELHLLDRRAQKGDHICLGDPRRVFPFANRYDVIGSMDEAHDLHAVASTTETHRIKRTLQRPGDRMRAVCIDHIAQCILGEWTWVPSALQELNRIL